MLQCPSLADWLESAIYVSYQDIVKVTMPISCRLVGKKNANILTALVLQVTMPISCRLVGKVNFLDNPLSSTSYNAHLLQTGWKAPHKKHSTSKLEKVTMPISCRLVGKQGFSSYLFSFYRVTMPISCRLVGKIYD